MAVPKWPTAYWMVGNIRPIRPKCFLRAHGLECTLLSISMNPRMRLFCRLGLLSLLIVCSATALEPLAPDTEQRATIREILPKLDKPHYRHLNITYTFSSALLEHHLNPPTPTKPKTSYRLMAIRDGKTNTSHAEKQAAFNASSASGIAP